MGSSDCASVHDIACRFVLVVALQLKTSYEDHTVQLTLKPSNLPLYSKYNKLYPGTFNQTRIEHFLPTMQTLNISSIFKKRSYFLPIFSSVFHNKFLKLLVFFGSPPIFLSLIGSLIVFILIIRCLLMKRAAMAERGRGGDIQIGLCVIVLLIFAGRGGVVQVWLHGAPPITANLLPCHQPPINKTIHNAITLSTSFQLIESNILYLIQTNIRSKFKLIILTWRFFLDNNQMANNSQKKNALRIGSSVLILTYTFYFLAFWFLGFNTYYLLGQQISIWHFLLCLTISLLNYFCFKQVLKCWQLQLPAEAAEYYYDIMAINSLVQLLDPFFHVVWNLYWLIVLYFGWQGLKWLWDYITPKYEQTEDEGETAKKEKKEKKEKVKYIKQR